VGYDSMGMCRGYNLNLSIARVLFAMSEMWLNGEILIFSEILEAVTHISSLIELILRVFLMV